MLHCGHLKKCFADVWAYFCNINIENPCADKNSLFSVKTNANRIIVKKRKKKDGNGRKEERERKEKRGEKDRKMKRKEERKGGKST